MKQVKDIISGDVFGRLTVSEYSHTGKHYRKYFKTTCQCGTEKILSGEALISGNTKSCGCLATQVKKSHRLPNNYSEITAVILGYKRHAVDRGVEWRLSREEVEELISQKCVYCGTEPSNVKKTKNTLGEGLRYSGIDRVDSTKSYEKGNVVPCCKLCNLAKRDLGVEEFKVWALRLGSHANSPSWGVLDRI